MFIITLLKNLEIHVSYRQSTQPPEAGWRCLNLRRPRFHYCCFTPLKNLEIHVSYSHKDHTSKVLNGSGVDFLAHYTGVHCPVCDKKFTDEDDIVVCPVCGTPHHRACYQQEGRCAFEEQNHTVSGVSFNRYLISTIPL